MLKEMIDSKRLKELESALRKFESENNLTIQEAGILYFNAIFVVCLTANNLLDGVEKFCTAIKAYVMAEVLLKDQTNE